jgi:cytochrome b6-f complex iron-sulfur subunit
MADETNPEGPAAAETPAPAPAAKPAAPAAAAHARPAPAPRPPAAPLPDLAGKTTSAASTGGAAAKAAVTTPAAKPAAAATRDPDDTSPLLTRRAWMGLAWGAFSAASAAALAATGRFMFPNVLNEPPQQFKAGFPNEYGVGVDERWKEKFGVWLVRTAEDIDQHASGFYALSTTCTHLGCTPNYLSAENKFKCPCHGSGFRTTGAAAARTRPHRPGGGRPDSGGQEPALPAGTRTVDGSRGVPEGLRSMISGIEDLGNF